MVTTWDNIAHVTAFHSIISIFIHQIESFVEVALIVDDARRSFMVHHQFHTLAVRIVVQSLDIKVGIGRNEIENIPFPHIRPVFPTYVPALNEYLLESVGSCEINVFLHVFGVGSMATVGFCLAPIHLIQLHRGIFIRVVPTALAYNHLPPNATILHRMYPTGVFKLARFVEIEYQT